jgi:thiol-disulfide isomerase/thioredoxin
VSRIVLAVALAAVSCLVTTAPASALGVGDKAPPLAPFRWVKGAPVEKFEPGTVYVVEFWATWCGPCRQSIPRLTAVAREFEGKAVVIGMSIWEERQAKDEQYVRNVEAFVKERDAEIGYRVAVDDREGTVAGAWMDAAKLPGIPTAFVVDRAGKIAWIGHPAGRLAAVVGKVVAGTFDPGKEAGEEQRAAAGMVDMQQRLQRINELASARPKEALAELDRFLAEKPDMERSLGFFRFVLLTRADRDEACAFAGRLVDGHLKDNPTMLRNVATMLLREGPATPPKALDAALAAAERAAVVSKGRDPYVFDTLAEVRLLRGERAKAIEAARKALELIDRAAGAPHKAKQEFRARLEKLEKDGAASPRPDVGTSQ